MPRTPPAPSRARFLTGFILIGSLGMQRTFLLAAAVNALVGLTALIVDRREATLASPALSAVAPHLETGGVNSGPGLDLSPSRTGPRTVWVVMPSRASARSLMLSVNASTSSPPISFTGARWRCSLYSREYFAVRNALNDAAHPAVDWPSRKSHYVLIMRTFLDVFPQATLWLGGQLMVGLAPLTLDEPRSPPGSPTR